jgi:hypothetical protein
VSTLKCEQARINAEVAEAESQLTKERREATQAKQIIDLALDLAKDCATSYRKAKPEVRKMWNRAFFRTIRVRDGAIARLHVRGALCIAPRFTQRVDGGPNATALRLEGC